MLSRTPNQSNMANSCKFYFAICSGRDWFVAGTILLGIGGSLDLMNTLPAAFIVPTESARKSVALFEIFDTF